METCYQLPPALAEVISPEKLGPINKHGIPWEDGREGSPARPALSPSPRWPINFSSEALGPGNLPVLSAHQATFSSLSCSLPVNQSPWEPGGMGGSSLEQQRAACLLTPRGLRKESSQPFPGQFWWKVSSFGTRLPESSESTGCSEGAGLRKSCRPGVGRCTHHRLLSRRATRRL